MQAHKPQAHRRAEPVEALSKCCRSVLKRRPSFDKLRMPTAQTGAQAHKRTGALSLSKRCPSAVEAFRIALILRQAQDAYRNASQ